ncbi:PH domain-containing protein [Aquipuribacter sp. SD81]|uniref:PH domain-containing protein n=1 Tax=Aquipuribacter sp. SD81 TaxID=3127703 RepID=UPI00301A3C3D
MQEQPPLDQPPAVPPAAPDAVPPRVPPTGDVLPGGAPGREPFDPVGVRWSRVSPRLVWVRLAGAGVFLLVTVVVAGVLALLAGDPLGWLVALPVVPGVVVAVVALLVVPRQVRAWGYAEREEDLLVRHGLMFRALTVVPYGRMQYVDVSAGPVDRALGLATVRLHTASASTDATIPGLTAEAAARLRDRLTQAGQAQLAGL